MNRRSFLGACCAPALAPLARPAPQPTRRPGRRVEVLRSVGGVPAEIVGAFRDPVAFAQAVSGQYYVFDRQAHTVYGIDQALTAAWKIVQIGGEAGRILQPTAFGLAPNGTFVVADRPGLAERVQVFAAGGAQLGGFVLPGRAQETITLNGVVLNGTGSLHYDGRRLLLSQPEAGALVAEYSLSGGVVRIFGELRRTGHESDRAVHLGLNSGMPIPAPDGVYFVFLAGVPAFRKYDRAGALAFERHVEGIEIDPIVTALPTEWPRRKGEDESLIPMIPPVVRTAAVDREGRLWVSFVAVPVTYVYDAAGEKVRVVRFEGAGVVSPAGLFFSHTGRLLVAPGCYEFSP
ncbi:MAG: Gluconolactonase [Acidobacteria bacterium]|nr:Gluconolactonase [Acidobacteriota bacterium]